MLTKKALNSGIYLAGSEMFGGRGECAMFDRRIVSSQANVAYLTENNSRDTTVWSRRTAWLHLVTNLTAYVIMIMNDPSFSTETVMPRRWESITG